MKKVNDYEYMIESIEDIEALKTKCCSDTDLKYFFRGQSNSDWNLSSSAFRTNKKEEKFSADKNLFDEISLLQHTMKKPTRFIDFSQDIYTALYFACSEKENMLIDGKIFICQYSPITEKDDEVKIICELTQLTKNTSFKEFVESVSTKYGFNQNKTSEKLYSFLTFGFIICPSDEYYERKKDYNINMYRQKGCFYIQGNESNIHEYSKNKHILGDDKSSIIIQPKISSNIIVSDRCLYQQFIIPHKLKVSILDYLYNKGINYNYLFPKK